MADKSNIEITIETTEPRDNDMRLRILYRYQMLLQHTDEDHPMTTQQIMERMEQEHGMTMHRTTVPSDISLLQAAGFEIIAERKQAWNYYVSDRTNLRLRYRRIRGLICGYEPSPEAICFQLFY